MALTAPQVKRSAQGHLDARLVKSGKQPLKLQSTTARPCRYNWKTMLGGVSGAG